MNIKLISTYACLNILGCNISAYKRNDRDLYHIYLFSHRKKNLYLPFYYKDGRPIQCIYG